MRLSMDDVYADDAARQRSFCSTWVVGTKCKSHARRNAVVWSLARYSDPDVRDSAHIRIKSLRNTSDELRRKIEEFVRTRARGVERAAEPEHVRMWWEWAQIRPDLMNFFVTADPVWDGTSLSVEN